MSDTESKTDYVVLHTVQVMLIIMKLGEVGKIGEWSWGYILSPVIGYSLWLIIGFVFLITVHAVKELKEKNK